MPDSSTYSKTFRIPKSSIDENGHLNNVAYVQWMQDIALEHYTAIGGIEAQGPHAAWVVREHRVEYFLPAFEGDAVEVRTWVENIRRVRLLRKYEFVRQADGRILVRGETDWVFVDTQSGALTAGAWVAMPLGMLLGGVLTDRLGTFIMMIGLAVTYLLTTLSMAFIPAMKEMNRKPGTDVAQPPTKA